MCVNHWQLETLYLAICIFNSSICSAYLFGHFRCILCLVVQSFDKIKMINIFISCATFVFAVADYGTWEYAISSSQPAVKPARHIQSNMPGMSYTTSSNVDIRATEGSPAAEMIQKADSGRAYEGVRAFSSLSGLEPPLKPSNANYCSPVFTRNDSILFSASRQMMSEPDSWFRGSCAPRAALSHNSSLRSARSSGDFLMDHHGSVPAVARPRSRSPISKHGEPSLRNNSAGSLSDDASHYRRLSSMEAGSSSDFSTDPGDGSVQLVARSRGRLPVSMCGEPSALLHNSASSVPDDVPHRRLRRPEAGSSWNLLKDDHRRSVLPSSRCRSPATKFGEQLSASLRSVSDVGENENNLRSGYSAAEQSAASSRKRHHQQQQQQPHHQPVCSSSSQLFTKKLARLRELRYAKSQRCIHSVSTI